MLRNSKRRVKDTSLHLHYRRHRDGERRRIDALLHVNHLTKQSARLGPCLADWVGPISHLVLQPHDFIRRMITPHASRRQLEAIVVTPFHSDKRPV